MGPRSRFTAGQGAGERFEVSPVQTLERCDGHRRGDVASFHGQGQERQAGGGEHDVEEKSEGEAGGEAHGDFRGWS